jgi:hypothetical protein
LPRHVGAGPQTWKTRADPPQSRRKIELRALEE